jgi:hypothetical protein
MSRTSTPSRTAHAVERRQRRPERRYGSAVPSATAGHGLATCGTTLWTYMHADRAVPSRSERQNPARIRSIRCGTVMPSTMWVRSAPITVDLQTDRPHAARIYDYVLGGKDNFEADRAVAEQMMAASPLLAPSMRANRRFMAR